jgi:hypothetical protein
VSEVDVIDASDSRDAKVTGGGVVAWFHCFSGISGDMALGSLIDAGAGLEEVKSILRRIPLAGWDLEIETTLRGGVSSKRAIVTTGDSDVVVRTHSHIQSLLTEARLPERVYQRSVAVFERLARVEGQLHHRPSDQVHFHEVGGHDAIIDIVGTVAALEVLNVEEIQTSPIATGMGVTRSTHGLLPNPSPAVVRLLRGVPTYGRNTHVELTTPTGAALVTTLSTKSGPMPEMTVTSSGFGAGSHDFDDMPNCTQVVIGTLPSGEYGTGEVGEELVVIESNLDDATGEQLSYAMTKLLNAGALDVWISPVTMKKGRPGHVISVLCDQVSEPDITGIIFNTTGTLGVRSSMVQRRSSPRSIDRVVVNGESIRMKVTKRRVKPEFSDVAAAADALDLPPAEIASLAEEQWRIDQVNPPDPSNQDAGSRSGSTQDSTSESESSEPDGKEPA